MEQISRMFSIEIFGIKSNPTKSAQNVGVVSDNKVSFCYMSGLQLMFLPHVGSAAYSPLL